MKIHVQLLAPYGRIAGQSKIEMELHGNTLEELIDGLIERFPALRESLEGEEIPGASPFLLVVNGNVVPIAADRPIYFRAGDTVTITRVVGGG